MMIAREKWIQICLSQQLAEHQHMTLDVLFAGEMISALVFRFHGQVYAYQNQCVHMVRRLDSESSRIFDKSGKLLSCSMHGIVYQPETGGSLSSICHGQNLTAIKVIESDGEVYFADKRVKEKKRN